MTAPTDKQQAIWKTYMTLTSMLDTQFGDEHHDLHQKDAIRQVALVADKSEDDIRYDITVVCEWLKECFTNNER